METRRRKPKGSPSDESPSSSYRAEEQSSTILYLFLGIIIGATVATAVVFLKENRQVAETLPDKTIKAAKEKVKQPHLIFILADDLGWGDVGWNNPDMITPHMNKLASEGVLLNQSYSQPLCTPSRAAFMSGYYPFRVGMQHQILWSVQPHGLPLNVTILPQKLRDLGYRTHMVGKWHLGMCKWEYTPTYRGFDSFYGYYSLLLTHFNKTHHTIQNRDIGGYDFRDNTGVVQPNEEFLTEMFVKRAKKLINDHPVNQPMFMYFALDLPKWPSETPQHYQDLYSDIENEDRRKHCAMVSAIDDTVGNLSQALKDRGMWEDTVLVFFSDNGGVHYLAGSNWPLRGAAGNLFEGSSRVPGFISGGSPMLKKRGYVNNELIHITDFHSTFVKLAGGELENDLDGMDVWDTISKHKPSPRKEMVYNIDDVEPRGSAIRVGDYKLILGNPEIFYPRRNINYTDGWHKPAKTNDIEFTYTPVRFGKVSEVPPATNVTLLFNLKDDPVERHDLSAKYPQKVEELRQRLKEHERRLMPAINPKPDFEGCNPKNYGGVWTPGWC